MPRVNENLVALVVPGLHRSLWRKRIDQFENDPRLCPSVTGADAATTETTRQRWVAAKLEDLEERGIRSAAQRYAKGEPFVFPRWVLGGHGPFEAFGVHPLASDTSVRWLSVDIDDLVTAAQEENA